MVSIFSHILSAENHESIFIPRGFAHGYLTLSEFALINYHVDNYYDQERRWYPIMTVFSI